jgi:hypothetical protein
MTKKGPKSRALATENSTIKTRLWRDRHKMVSVGTALTPEEYAIAERLKAHYGSLSTAIKSLIMYTRDLSLDALPPIYESPKQPRQGKSSKAQTE